MTGKIAVVTGAGSGIGKAVTLAFAKAGYTVVLAGRNLERLQKVAEEGGPRCHPFATDVTREGQVASLFTFARDKFERVDVLFNNAGASAPATPIEELSINHWRSVIDTNLTGAFFCAQAAFRVMKAQSPQGGRIINNGSIAAYVPRPHLVAYTASKHAVSGLTKSCALEGRKYNIACGQIDIGNAATDMATPMINGTMQADFTTKSEPTFDVKHVANAVLYMAGLPLDANVLTMTVMATAMPYVGRG